MKAGTNGRARSVGKTFVEKIANSTQKQQGQDAHAAATRPEQATKQQAAQCPTEQTTHEPSPESTRRRLLGCRLLGRLLPLLSKPAGSRLGNRWR